MQALEELAMSYDYKDREIESACQERDQLRVDMEMLKVVEGEEGWANEQVVNMNHCWKETPFSLPSPLSAVGQQS